MSDVLAGVLSLAFVAQAVRISVPYLLAALGGAVTERAGLVDLALEAKLLLGAFAAATVTYESGSIALGVVAAAVAGVAVAAVQAAWALRLGAEQVVTGIALNLAAMGLTRYLLQVRYGTSSNSPPIEGLRVAVWSNPLVWIALALAVAVTVVIGRSRFGLRVRAAGERPEAVAAAGLSVARVRWIAALIGGAIAGLGGAQLSLSVGGFVGEMSSGRGYVALAAVIMGGWRPAIVALVCLGFGTAEALQVLLQGAGTGLPPELVRFFPHAVALILLAVVGGRSRAPSALGRRI